MGKNKKAATFILKYGLQSTSKDEILGRLVKTYPDDGFLSSDVSNAFYEIEQKGFTLANADKVKPRRRRKNPLLHGDYADAACYVSSAIGRFNQEEKKKFVDILRDKL
jgi:hypothetical protein